MFRKYFGGKDNQDYCVRFDAFETKVTVEGSLTVPELDQLIDLLIQARRIREDEHG